MQHCQASIGYLAKNIAFGNGHISSPSNNEKANPTDVASNMVIDDQAMDMKE